MKTFVSVIIPTRNEEKHIKKCLGSLVGQTYPKDKFEVLIIDGMSKDETSGIVKGFKEKINLRILENRRNKHVYAFNKGIKMAKGDYVILLSGHSFVENDFIEKCVNTFFKIKEKEPKLAAVGGKLEAVYENIVARLVSLLYSSPFSGVSDFWYSKNPHFVNHVGFGFYHKEAIKKIGCFDEDMVKGNDFELDLRLSKNGYKLYYNPEIKSHKYARSSFLKFLKQSVDNGAAKGLCVRKGYFKIFWFIPLAFILYQLLVFSGVFTRSLGLPVVSFIPFIMYWIINILVSLQLLKEDVYHLLLPIMYWILHTVVGFGFLMGMLLGKNAYKL